MSRSHIHIAGHKQRNTACCSARSDKCRTKGPQGIAWGTFHTLNSIPTFSCSDKEAAASGCCAP
jgi:hypothetical protein